MIRLFLVKHVNTYVHALVSGCDESTESTFQRTEEHCAESFSTRRVIHRIGSLLARFCGLPSSRGSRGVIGDGAAASARQYLHPRTQREPKDHERKFDATVAVLQLSHHPQSRKHTRNQKTKKTKNKKSKKIKILKSTSF